MAEPEQPDGVAGENVGRSGAADIGASRLARSLLGAPLSLDRDEAAAALGVSLEDLVGIWRALGFADVGAGSAFAATDIEAIGMLLGFVRAGILDSVSALDLLRSIAQTSARLADWQVETLARAVAPLPSGHSTRRHSDTWRAGHAGIVFVPPGPAPIVSGPMVPAGSNPEVGSNPEEGSDQKVDNPEQDNWASGTPQPEGTRAEGTQPEGNQPEGPRLEGTQAESAESSTPRGWVRVADSGSQVTGVPDGGEPTVSLVAARVEQSLPALERLLIHVWRRQLFAVVERMARDPGAASNTIQCVGFADIAGFTRIVRSSTPTDLSALVTDFETGTADIVAATGARLIKTVGDEVMFAADEPRTAALVALALHRRHSAGSGRPALRIGLATGKPVMQMGDLYGDPVNLASRLTAGARPGSTLVDSHTAAALSAELSKDGAAEAARAGESEQTAAVRFKLRPLAPRRFRGFGLVRAYSLTGYPSPGPASPDQQ